MPDSAGLNQLNYSSSLSITGVSVEYTYIYLYTSIYILYICASVCLCVFKQLGECIIFRIYYWLFISSPHCYFFWRHDGEVSNH